MKKTHAKTCTWLLLSGLLIFGAAYIETQRFYVSFMTAAWACIIKTPAYWAHEHVWEAWAYRKAAPIGLNIHPETIHA